MNINKKYHTYAQIHCQTRQDSIRIFREQETRQKSQYTWQKTISLSWQSALYTKRQTTKYYCYSTIPRKTSLHCCRTCWRYASNSGCTSWTPSSVQRQQSGPSKLKQMRCDSYFSLTFSYIFSSEIRFKSKNKHNNNYSIRALFSKLTTDRDHTTDSTATEFILTMILKETRRLADWQSHEVSVRTSD